MRTNKTNTVTLAAAVLAISTLSLESALAADAKTSVSVEIGAQSLEAALVELSKQGHLQLVIATGSLPARMSAPLHGRMALGMALDLLLKDTGLTYKLVGDHTIAIVKRQLSDPPASPGATGATTSPGTPDVGGNPGEGATRKNATKGDQSVNHRSLMLRLATFLGLCVSTAVQGPACAQNVSAADTEGGRLEEIIVTARRREENIQKVPIAITAVSQSTLQDNNIQTVGDLQYLVPSLTANPDNNGGFTRDSLNVTIRGQGISGLAGLPAVVGYMNEVPLPTDKFGAYVGGPGTLFDLDNVQVLKGPQGTLFGRNTTGGALLLTTARPTNEFGGHVQVGYGNYNDREIDGAVNLPIIDNTLLARIAFNGQLRDGFTNVLSEPSHPGGIDADNRNYWSTRGTVTFRPNDQFQNETIVTYQSYDTNGSPTFLYAVNPSSPIVTATYPTLPALLAQQQALGVRTMLPLSTDTVGNGNSVVLNNTTRVTIGDNITFRNIFGYVRARTNAGFEWDGTNLGFLDILVPPSSEVQSQYTEEAQLLGKSLGGNLDWITGVFYLNDTPEGYTATRQVIFNGSYLTEDKRGSKSTGLYAHGIYDLSAVLSGLQLAAGVRYTWDRRSYEELRCTNNTDCAANGTISEPSNNSALTWDASLDYQVTQNTLVYLTSRRGYRAGGANPSQDFAIPTFKPEYVTDVELGIKSDWKAGNVPMRTDLAIYHQDYTDIQVTQQIPDPMANLGFDIATTNGAAARVEGVELETRAQLTRNFETGLFFDYLDFAYTKFDPGVQNPESFLEIETAGRPRFKYGVDALLRLPVDARIGDIAARANWSWQSRNGDTLEPFGMINAYGILNVSLDWKGLYSHPLDVSFFMSNALNKDYVITNLAAYNTLAIGAVRYGEPRLYGLRLRYSFGASK